MDDDNRFSIIYTDPRFKKVPKYERKVKIDKRFQSIFTDKRFKVKYTIDKRGRPFCRSTTEDYKKFYDLPSDVETDEKSSATDEDSEKSDCKDQNKLNLPSDEIDESDDSSTGSSEDEKNVTDKQKLNSIDDINDVNKSGSTKEKFIDDKTRNKLRDINIDYARGENNLVSESSSDESESEDSDSDDFEHKWGEFDNDAEHGDQVTSRLAVCNMDWDRIRAEDLMMLFHSFLPQNGIIHSLAVYPSEYGLKRMKEEELNGPTELVNRNNNESSDDSENDHEEAAEGNAYHRECLRQYQLNRLKYYYAIITFDSPETADKIYKECDNMEYESSSTRLDLRFVPDDVVFDQQPKDICDRVPDVSKYKPRYFTTTALQQAKVELTWDETDPGRQEFTQKVSEALKSGDIDDADLATYVALSSGEEEDESTVRTDDETINEENRKNEDPIVAYRNLLKEIEEKEQNKDDVQLEISWGPDEEVHHQRKQEKQRTVSEDQDGGKNDLTPYQKLVEKDVEKRKQRKKFKKLKIKQAISDQAKAEDGSSDEIHFGNEEGEEDAIEETNSASIIDSDDVDNSDELETQKKAELELLLMDDNDGDEKKRHFSFKKIKENEAKRRRRKRKEKLSNASNEQTDDVQVDVHDKRFEAIYYSHLFNIDPANPHFNKTKGMEAFIVEKQKRKAENIKPTTNEESLSEVSPAKMLKMEKSTNDVTELSSLVKSVKRKTQLLLVPKNVK